MGMAIASASAKVAGTCAFSCFTSAGKSAWSDAAELVAVGFVIWALVNDIIADTSKLTTITVVMSSFVILFVFTFETSNEIISEILF
jgi:hypothetical protein